MSSSYTTSCIVREKKDIKKNKFISKTKNTICIHISTACDNSKRSK